MDTKVQERNFTFDSIKGVMVFLVVFGHTIEKVIYKSDGFMKYIYTFIYLFHMPIFIFISGFFSKKNNLKKIWSFAYTYIIWQMVIYPLGVSLFTNKSFFDVLRPIYYPQPSYWYLLAIIIWRLLTPYVNKIKFIVPISIVFSLAFGFINSDFNLQYFTIGRLFVFYPFFILGYRCSKEKINKWMNCKQKLLMLTLFITIMSLATVLIHYMAKYGVVIERPNRILMPHYYYKDCYNSLKVSFLIKTFILIIQLISIPLIFKFFIKKRCFFSEIGRNSLYIYLSHMILIDIMNVNYISKLTFNTANTFLLVSFAASLIYCYLLSKVRLFEFLKEKFLNIVLFTLSPFLK